MCQPLRTFSALALTLLFALAARPSAAEEDPRIVAGQLVELAGNAYAEGEFKSAAEWLEKAYQLDPNPVILYNLGRALEGAGELDAALAAMEQLQADPTLPEDLKPRVKIELARIQNLRAGTLQFGQLAIRTEPAGAKVYIDGVKEAKASPMARTIDVGEHQLLIVLDGYQSVEQSFTVAKEQSVDIDLLLVPVGGFDQGMSSLEIGAYVAFGVGAAGLVTGIACYFPAASAFDDYDKLRNAETRAEQKEGEDARDSGQTLSMVSAIGYGVGIAGVLIGAGLLTWALLDDDGTTTETAWQPAFVGVDPQGGVRLGWQF